MLKPKKKYVKTKYGIVFAHTVASSTGDVGTGCLAVLKAKGFQQTWQVFMATHLNEAADITETKNLVKWTPPPHPFSILAIVHLLCHGGF